MVANPLEKTEYQYGFHDDIKPVFKSKRGLNRAVVEEISHMKNEPDWMRKFRLRSLEMFERRPMPNWGSQLLHEIDFDNIYYYLKPSEQQSRSWDDVPSEIKNTFDRLGIPEAEKKFLAGVGAQYESEVVYHNIHADLEKKGVIFCGTDEAVHQYPELMHKYFGKIIPPNDNKFDSLHSAVVEIIVEKGARCRYTTIQNWSKNVYNLVTKRAAAYQDATMEWVDGNLGSKLTMKYPSVFMMEPGAKGEILSIAFAGDGQHQDAGGKVVHLAPWTSSSIVSKSISKGTGRASYRGLLKIARGAIGAKSSVRCDALLLNENSRTDTYPYIEVEEDRKVATAHEASVSKVGEDQLFYLMSRGLDEVEATSMIVRGFIEPIAKELNRLIQLEMEGSVG